MAQVTIETNPKETLLGKRSVEAKPDISTNKSYFWRIIGFISLCMVPILLGFNLSTLVDWIILPTPPQSLNTLVSYTLQISIFCFVALGAFVIFKWIKDEPFVKSKPKKRKDYVLFLGACTVAIFLSWMGLLFISYELTALALFINTIFGSLLFIFSTYKTLESFEEKLA